MSQTSYAEQSTALPGMKGDLSPSKVSTYVSAARHPFGYGACLGADKEKQVMLPGASTDITDIRKFRGVVLKDHTVENVVGDGLAPGVEAKKPLSILEKGHVWVVCNEDVVPTDTVHLNYAGADIGTFRNDVDTANAAAVPGARFRSNSITVDGVKIALLELY